MSAPEKAAEDNTKIETKDLADLMLDSLDGYSLTAAEIVAALEVAKSVVLMDCVAELVAATRAEEFVKDMLDGEKRTVN